jgi:SAM-dependent methyltransferase
MRPIDPTGFERKFLNNLDPWDYTNSPFERHKRDVLLRACGCRTYGRGLELGCAIGETTKRLAPLCMRLLAVDSSITALNEARRRLKGNSRVTFLQAVLPAETPRGMFDLIVASELVYYLKSIELRDLLQRLRLITAPGGRIVFLNHIRQFDDASQLPNLAQKRLRSYLNKTMRMVFHARHARFDAVSFITRVPRSNSFV